jgi:hypothetical protein
MSYKRVRNMAKSYAMDTETGEIVGKSFTAFAKEQKWTADYSKKKREQLLEFIAAKPDKAKFAVLMGKEIYITEEGEKFVKTCNMVLSQKHVVTPLKERVSVEKLDNGNGEKKDYVIRAEEWIADLASMSTQTHHPFSTKKPFISPYNTDKRVFIDLYRQVNNVHEGYIVLGSTGTVNGIQSVLLNAGSAVVMGRKFGESTQLYIVAQKFDERAIEYVKYNLSQNVRCMTLKTLTEKLVREATEYFEEGDACFKLREWTERYASLFVPSTDGDSSNNVRLFTSVAA